MVLIIFAVTTAVPLRRSRLVSQVRTKPTLYFWVCVSRVVLQNDMRAVAQIGRCLQAVQETQELLSACEG